jgi:hypothetical protein
MHRYNRFGARRNCLFDTTRIDVVCKRIDVYEDRSCPNQRYRLSGSNKCVGSCYDLIARSYANREECQMQCGGSGTNSNRAIRSYGSRECIFEVAYFFAEDEGGVVNDSLYAGVNLRLDGEVLCLEVY